MWRSGRLVRMDRDGALPGRCVSCNAPAEGERIRRKLHYSPLAWRIGAPLAPFIALLIGVYAEVPLLAVSFWPLAIILLVAHLFVRKSVQVEFGVCARHRDLRLTLMSLSWMCVAGVFVGMFTHPLALLGSIAGLVVLALVQSYVGVQALRLKELSGQHAWLSGTGSPFRSGLPELN